jgi:hypothetical protein
MFDTNLPFFIVCEKRRFAVRHTAAIGKRGRKNWKRAIGSAVTITLLSAVVVVGLFSFGAEVLAAWKTPGHAEHALSAGGAFAALLNFEAPAQTVARVKAHTEKPDQNSRRAGIVPLLVKNWKYTQNPIADFLQLLQAAINNYVMEVQQIEAAVFAAVAAYVNAFVTAYVNLVNSLNYVNTFTPINSSNNSSSSSSSNSASPSQ